ncbi:TPA: phage tail protein [Pseudomonas aeruginosa]|nr:phage tail protein [Pseudomonas aeruginosa]HBO8942599.1 phage tail protein [Pseudomonas aeruginosa]HBO9282250.1 phage tail protein [Pseudomonas aeruginosa]
MAWYSSGTVTVTANSPTVTGAGTQFSSNARVGDAFRGPDGRWYEVTNVASSTVISIKPNYQGSTASGQAYAVAPILGYDKDLSDRFNLIANQWGATLAGIQPWATAPTPAAARTDLGAAPLASPALTGNPTAPTPAATSNDTSIATTGYVKKVLATNGLGTDSASGAVGDLNEVRYGGITAPVGASNAPAVELILWSGGRTGGARASQLAIDHSLNARAFIRGYNSGRPAAEQWGPWRELFHTGNILGTVSQSGGAPTGAIIERGSNANGEYVRFADGTQICIVTLLGDGSQQPNTSISLPLPAAFLGNWSTGVSVSWASHVSNPSVANGLKVAYANGSTLFFILQDALATNRLIFTLVGRWF